MKTRAKGWALAGVAAMLNIGTGVTVASTGSQPGHGDRDGGLGRATGPGRCPRAVGSRHRWGCAALL